MDTHCKVDLLTQHIVEKCGVPVDLAGLAAEVLADPASHLDPCPPDHIGFGYWPILYAVPPYEPATQRLSDQMDETPDQTTKAILVRPRVMDLTPAELAAKAAAAASAVAAARAAAVAANNMAAGRAREAYLTAVPGQSTTYAAKQAEADRWVTAGKPTAVDAAAYPWAADRADLIGATIPAVLAEWSAVAAAWAVTGRRIERERERINRLIADAASLSGIQAALDSADYSSA